MRISVFGLGYVGTVSAACFARDGHEITGVDPNTTKVDLINAGQSPVIEAGLAELVAESRSQGRLRATTEAREGVEASDLSLVCVGTPSQANGDLDLRFLRAVCEEIGKALADKDDYHVVVIRSTVLPGTMHDVVIPVLEGASGKQVGRDFGLCNNPEFLREGTAVRDFDEPPKTIIGQYDARSGDVVASLYARLAAPEFRVDMPVGEMVKYVDNCWHALKVGFANEIGTIAKQLSIDSHEVMALFCSDTKLNISPAYLKPGQAFGGSCLPKDLRALTYRGRSLDLELPILGSILPSNELHVRRALEMVMAKGNRKIGLLGFSFKAGTDDLRESPVVEIVERLIGKGYDLRLFDRNVQLSKLMGANREFILNQIPHIARLMVDTPEELLDHADTLVIGNRDPAFEGLLAAVRPEQSVVDLVRIARDPEALAGYEGLCW